MPRGPMLYRWLVELPGQGRGMADKTLSSDPTRRNDSRKAEEALGIAASLAGIAASLASVAGFLLSLHSGDGLWLLCGLGTAAFLLYAAWRRHWMAVAASALVLAVAGIGGLLAHFHTPTEPAAASPSTSASTAAHPIAPGGSSATSSGAQVSMSTPQPRVLEITLPRHAAVDLDPAGQPSVITDQIGATGPYDLYHDAGEVMSDTIRTHDGVYAYPAGSSPDSAYAICSDYTSAHPSYNAYNPSAGAQTGATFCFRTTEGKLAWATVEAVQPDTNTVVLQVRIWG